MSNSELLEKLKKSKRLPVLPTIALQILELQNDEDLYPAKVHSVLASDPALAARILQVANSAMFRRMRSVHDLSEAITTLGVQLSMSIATGVAVIDALREDETHNDFPHESFWRKSILGAVAANEIFAQLDNVQSRGALFTASLMQDLGILALYTILGERYARLVNSARSHFDLVLMEKRALGIDHAEVGGMLMRQWGLPDEIAEAVENSHALFDVSSGRSLSDFHYGVSLSGVLAELWIAQAHDSELLNQTIKGYLEKVGDEAYHNTVASILDAIPGANDLFDIQLLSDEQMASVA